MIYSGSVLNPQQQQQAQQPVRPAFNQQPNLQQQPHQQQQVHQAPASPVRQPVQHVAAPFSPPQAGPAAQQGHQQQTSAASPAGVKQAAPKPWVPTDGNSNKVSDLPCGNSTAHKGVSTYYSSAPLDPSKIPVCSGCHVNIR